MNRCYTDEVNVERRETGEQPPDFTAGGGESLFYLSTSKDAARRFVAHNQHLLQDRDERVIASSRRRELRRRPSRRKLHGGIDTTRRRSEAHRHQKQQQQQQQPALFIHSAKLGGRGGKPSNRPQTPGAAGAAVTKSTGGSLEGSQRVIPAWNSAREPTTARVRTLFNTVFHDPDADAAGMATEHRKHYVVPQWDSPRGVGPSPAVDQPVAPPGAKRPPAATREAPAEQRYAASASQSGEGGAAADDTRLQRNLQSTAPHITGTGGGIQLDGGGSSWMSVDPSQADNKLVVESGIRGLTQTAVAVKPMTTERLMRAMTIARNGLGEEEVSPLTPSIRRPGVGKTPSLAVSGTRVAPGSVLTGTPRSTAAGGGGAQSHHRVVKGLRHKRRSTRPRKPRVRKVRPEDLPPHLRVHSGDGLAHTKMGPGVDVHAAQPEAGSKPRTPDWKAAASRADAIAKGEPALAGSFVGDDNEPQQPQPQQQHVTNNNDSSDWPETVVGSDGQVVYMYPSSPTPQDAPTAESRSGSVVAEHGSITHTTTVADGGPATHSEAQPAHDDGATLAAPPQRTRSSSQLPLPGQGSRTLHSGIKPLRVAAARSSKPEGLLLVSGRSSRMNRAGGGHTTQERQLRLPTRRQRPSSAPATGRSTRSQVAADALMSAIKAVPAKLSASRSMQHIVQQRQRQGRPAARSRRTRPQSASVRGGGRRDRRDSLGAWHAGEESVDRQPPRATAAVIIPTPRLEGGEQSRDGRRTTNLRSARRPQSARPSSKRSNSSTSTASRIHTMSLRLLEEREENARTQARLRELQEQALTLSARAERQGRQSAKAQIRKLEQEVARLQAAEETKYRDASATWYGAFGKANKSGQPSGPVHTDVADGRHTGLHRKPFVSTSMAR